MPALPIDQRVVVVKNTFIEEQEENQVEDGFHQLGVRTCPLFRFSKLTRRKLLDDVISTCSTDMPDESTPSILHSESSGLTFVSTPTGSECDFFRDKAETPNAAKVSASICKTTRQLMLSIPTKAPCSAEAFPEVNVIVSNMNMDPSSGSTVVDLRFVIASQLKAAPVVPTSTTVCLSQLLGASPMGSSTIACPVGEKSDKVCCHWKNKGWCKYAGTCKFQHPAHKQGVGKAQKVPGTLVKACRNGKLRR